MLILNATEILVVECLRFFLKLLLEILSSVGIFQISNKTLSVAKFLLKEICPFMYIFLIFLTEILTSFYSALNFTALLSGT